MSDVKQRPIKATADASDWLVVQSDDAGLGDEKRVSIGNVLGSTLNSHRSLLAIGDSNTQFQFRSVKNASGSAFGIEPMYVIGTAIITDATTGSLVYTQSTGLITWQDAGDTGPGVGIPAVPGVWDLESASANRGIRIGIRSTAALTTNRTLTVSYSGTVQIANLAKGWLNQVLMQSGQRFEQVLNLGIQSLRASEASLSGMLSFYLTQAANLPTPYFLVSLGTNDISDDADSAEVIWSNIKTVVDALLNAGIPGAIVGLHARYKTGTTQLDTTQLNKLLAVNVSARAYADSRYDLKYIDSYRITVNNAVTTGTPQTNMLEDHVHFAAQGSAKVARDIVRVLNAQQFSDVPIDFNSMIHHAGHMQGLPITCTGTRVTGTCPTGIMNAGDGLTHDFGTDVGTALVSSVVSRDGKPAWKWAVTSAVDGQRFSAASTNYVLPATIAATGSTINVGDTIWAEVDVEFENVAKAVADLFIYSAGGTNRYICANLYGNASSAFNVTVTPIENGKVRLRTPKYKIPTGVTSVRLFMTANLGINATGNIYWSDLKFYKQ